MANTTYLVSTELTDRTRHYMRTAEGLNDEAIGTARLRGNRFERRGDSSTDEGHRDIRS